MDGNSTTITVTKGDTIPIIEICVAKSDNDHDDIIKIYLAMAELYKASDGYMLHVIMKTVVYRDIGEDFENALSSRLRQSP